MQKNGFDISVGNFRDGVFVQNLASLNDRNGPFDRYNLTGVLILEILCPCLEDFGGEFAALVQLQAFFRDLYFVSETEYVYDVLVGVESDRTQKCRYWLFLLTVDVGVHHVVDVCREFNP